MRSTRLLLSFAAAALLPVAAPATATAQMQSADPIQLDSSILDHYRWRNIGPDRGGRSIAATGVRGRPDEAYFGAVGGGLWKTVNGGEDWAPVTDFKITAASVGAVAVSETNPDLVFIGTGETCIRGNIMPGDGVYRSNDAGETWTHVGFRDSHGISKIRIHPMNPDVVFVASFGKYSAPSEERGVFKSSDGGDTWRRVLYRNDETGAIDISIDRNNPDVMYAALWQAYRKEYQMSSGGPGSGLFKSTDGGETWTEITRNPGLPQEGIVGRIGVSVSRANSNRVYALIENDNGGLFSSDDAGASWELVNDDRSIRQRSFYYTHVFADPHDEDVVYTQNTSVFRSEDGGKTMTAINNGTHGDFHDFWIDPDDATHLAVGNDGGGAVSTNTGESWTDQEFPTSQFYHVVTTGHLPFHACGSQQDNSTLCTPSDWNAGAFARSTDPDPDLTAGSQGRSYRVGGGEPGYIAPDPKDLNLFYSGTNNGAYIDKYNRTTDTHREVNPYPWFYSGEPSRDIRERWQWTFPIIFSPVDPNVLFVSSQRLWKTTDGGNNWTALSGDLTRADPSTQGHSGGPITGDMNGPEVYATVFSVAPGKLDVNVIWTGSDDGLVHVTRDGGTTWTNITPDDMPDFGRVSQMDASAFDDGTVYMSVRRPLLDDFSPYIWKTNDYGQTWTKIVKGIREDAYVHTVREDPTRRGLLYAGTQHGAYISYDDGANWQELNPNLPDVPIADLIVEQNSLVIGTHGRSFWVLDNVAPLRQMTAGLTAMDAKMFEPPTAYRSGGNVILSWWVKDAPAYARLDILDAAGEVVQSVEGRAKVETEGEEEEAPERSRYDGPILSVDAGINTFAWDLRAQGFQTFPGMILWGVRSTGPAVPPGEYTVRLTADNRTVSAPLRVEANPWIPDVNQADMVAQYEFSKRVRDRVDEANREVVAIRRAKTQLDLRYEQSDDQDLRRAGDRLVENTSEVEANIYQVRNRSGQDPLNFPIKVNNRLANLMSMAERGDGRPMNNMPEIFDILSNELQGYQARLREIWNTDLVEVNRVLQRLGLDPIDPHCPATGPCTIS